MAVPHVGEIRRPGLPERQCHRPSSAYGLSTVAESEHISLAATPGSLTEACLNLLLRL